MAISKIGSNATGFASGLDISDGDITVASGHGVSFAATSDATDMSSELLDDYEEGLFTFTTNANIGLVSSSNIGKYTKIGRVVHVQAKLDLSSVSSTNHVYFNAMPFTNGSSTSSTMNGEALGTIALYNVNFDDDANYHYAVMGAGSQTVYIYASKDNGNWDILTNSELTSSSEIGLNITYQVD